MSNKTLNPSAIIALKEALSQIYWYKRDLRAFISGNLNNPAVLTRLNWDDYKRNIVGQVVDLLVQNQERYQTDLLNLTSAICSMEDFSHLLHLENGKEKARMAENSVRALRKYYAAHREIYDEKREAEQRRKSYAEKLKEINAVQDQLHHLYSDFCELVTSSQPQLRGYRLEKLLRQLFELFDLDPKASFRITGEQIDGAFTFDGIDYLFEAKWQEQAVSADSLDSFAAKVKRKLDNTLGLFVSINGFSPDAVQAHSQGRRVLLLMDGGDLMAVLENRIDLQELLLRKRRYASQTGSIYVSAHELL